jgi:hypothetical protein
LIPASVTLCGRFGFGLVPLFAGLDKYFTLLTNWEKSDPDSNTRDCALTCAKSGFGIVDKEGRLNDKGNQEALKLPQSSSKKDPLRVDVTGSKEGSVMQVKSLKMS